MMDTGISAILEKRGAQKAAAKERKAEREETGNVSALIIDRTPAGLYTCRYPRGHVPDELKGAFTKKATILSICDRRGILVGA